MPVYEYECSGCGLIEEAFQKISDAPLKECSKCKGELKKLVSQSSFHLKGSGWYVTDYGGSKGNQEKSPSKNNPKEDSVKSDKKVSEKVPEKKTAPKK